MFYKQNFLNIMSKKEGNVGQTTNSC